MKSPEETSPTTSITPERLEQAINDLLRRKSFSSETRQAFTELVETLDLKKEAPEHEPLSGTELRGRRDFLPRFRGEPANDSIRQWRQELTDFYVRLDELYANPEYREKFVAMKNGEVIDVDENDLQLAERICQRFPDEVVLITKVTLKPLPVLEVSSPEIR